VANDRKHEMRLCRDCRFYKNQGLLINAVSHGCARVDYDPVDGRALVSAYDERKRRPAGLGLFASYLLRRELQKCGPEGQYWEDKDGGE
jgi:hypothetical protein